MRHLEARFARPGNPRSCSSPAGVLVTGNAGFVGVVDRKVFIKRGGRGPQGRGDLERSRCACPKNVLPPVVGHAAPRRLPLSARPVRPPRHSEPRTAYCEANIGWVLRSDQRSRDLLPALNRFGACRESFRADSLGGALPSPCAAAMTARSGMSAPGYGVHPDWGGLWLRRGFNHSGNHMRNGSAGTLL